MLKEGGRLIKETDPLPIGWLLASVSLQVVTISRDPRDSIASFKRDDLYTQWGYKEKMDRFAHTVRSNPELAALYIWGGVNPLDDITMLPKHRQLAYYYAVTLREIERTTTVYNPFRISYEQLVTDPQRAFRQMRDFLSLQHSPNMEHFLQDRTTQTRNGGVHGTFRSASHLHTFQNILTTQEEADIRSICQELGILLDPPLNQQFPTTEWGEFERYEKKTDIVTRRGREIVATEIITNSVPIDNGAAQVSKYLITNEQYAQFLYWLKRHDILISYRGKPIFYNDRPQSRLHYDDINVMIDQGFENHPVTYVNWLGAYVYAAWIGGRLPLEREWLSAVNLKEEQARLNKDTTNYAEYYGNTTPVGMFPANQIGIYDALGNAAVWLADMVQGNSFEARRQGIGWNHTEERLEVPQKRPYWLGASGLGIRPIFDQTTHIIDDADLAKRIEGILVFLTQQPHNDITLDNKKLWEMMQDLTNKRY